jgi:hypothetical protein
MTTISTIGLSVFVAFVLTAFVVLAVDGVRAVTGQVTVTEWAVREPSRMFLLVAAAGFAACGLAVHLYFFEPTLSR